MKAKYCVILLLFVYFFAVYDINFHGPDEHIYYAYSTSIVEDGDLNIINQIGLDQSNFYVSKTYNLPDFHSYGSVVLFMPFYGYAKFIYLLAGKLGLENMTAWDFNRIAKCVMSFSTIIFGLFIIFFTYKLCRSFFSSKISLCSVVAISLGTPFFYYAIHDVGQASIAGCLLAVLSIWLCAYMVNMKRLEWFLYGLFFSVCVAVRIEFWLQLFFMLPFFVILRKLNKIEWQNIIYFSAGFIIIFLLRTINAYIKFGSFHLEELALVVMTPHYYCPFNGLFSQYRSVFYTSPILYICLAGFIFVVAGILRNHDKERRMRDIFIFILSAYLVIKLFLIRKAFGIGIEILGPRWLLMDFVIFVLLFAKLLQEAGKPLRVFILCFAVFSVFWNFFIISESLTALDWVYMVHMPGISARLKAIKYIFDFLSHANNLDIKLKYCLPLFLIVSGLIFYLASRFVFPANPSFWYVKGNNRQRPAKLFILFTVYLSIAYLGVTLLNIYNNRRNAEILERKGYFLNAKVIETPALKINAYEESYLYIHMIELLRYYALTGNLKMMDRIIDFEEKHKVMDSYFYPGFIRPTKPHDNLIDAYKEAGYYKETIDCYREIIRTHHGNADGYVGLGDIYMWIGNYNKAIETFKAAAQFAPINILVYSRLAATYREITNYDKAIENFNKAIQLNPNFIDAYINLGYIYKDKAEYDKAIEYFEKTIQLNPYSADAHISLGHIYHTKKDYKKAIDYYQRTIKINPNFIDAHINLGYIYRTKGDTQDVLRQVNELRKLKKDDLANELEQSIKR